MYSITLPDGLKSIADTAFAKCTGLTSLTLPDSLKSIGELAFGGCTSLTSVVFRSQGSLEIIGRGAFTQCTGLTSLTLPDSLENVGECAFRECASLTSVVFRPPVGRGAFIAWAVGNMRNRVNWHHTSLSHLCGVLHLVTVLALERRDVVTVDPGGENRVFEGCTSLTL